MADDKPGTIFDLPKFKPYLKRWNARILELNTRASYYDGSIYRNGRTGAAIWSLGPRIAKEIKPLFLPLSRAVDIDSGIIGGDWKFPPVEIEPKSEVWDEARDTLFDMSSWDTKGVLYIHYGAMYGVSGIRIAAEEDEKRIILQPSRPTCFMLIYEGEYSSRPTMGLWIEKKTDENGELFEYAEVITPDLITTYKNGQLWDYSGKDKP